MSKQDQPSEYVRIPRYLYDHLRTDSELVDWLKKNRGRAWIKAVQEEMETAKKYNVGTWRATTIKKKHVSSTLLPCIPTEPRKPRLPADWRSRVFKSSGSARIGA